MKGHSTRKSFVKKVNGETIPARGLGEGSVVHPKEKYDTPEEFVQFLRHLYAYEYAERFEFAQTVLDVGCGMGYGIHEMSTKGMNTIGIDVWKEGIYYCHKKYGRKTSFLVGDGLKLPFRNNCIDLVVSFQVIEHINPNKVTEYLEEAKRVLKDNGAFMVSTPNRRLRLLPLQKPWNPDHKKEYGAKDLNRVLKKVFENVKILGWFATKDVYLVEYDRVRQNPLRACMETSIASTVKHILPICFATQLEKAIAKRRTANERSRRSEAANCEFSVQDFKLHEKPLEACIDLYGICTKETRQSDKK